MASTQELPSQSLGAGAWVTSERLDVDKINVVKGVSSEGYERFKIVYQYGNAEPRDLIITVPKVPDAYIKCRGVQKDIYNQGERKIVTNRYGCQFIINNGNQYHKDLYESFVKIKQKVEEITGCTASFPVKDLETYSILYTNLIHSNDGRMFSAAYTATDQLDIIECRSCITRPAFLLSILGKSNTEIKIRVQLSQMYVHEVIREFPLAHMD